jgi:hypothetical protein
MTMQPALLLDLTQSPSRDKLPRRLVELAVAIPTKSESLPEFLRLNTAHNPLEAAPPAFTPRERFSIVAASRGLFFYLADAASDVFSPLVIRKEGSFVRQTGSFWLCLAVASFIVWAAYFAVPGLPQSIPLNSTAGAGYLALLVPASIMASCLTMSLGRLAGRAIERLASSCVHRDTTEAASNSPTLSDILEKA